MRMRMRMRMRVMMRRSNVELSIHDHMCHTGRHVAQLDASVQLVRRLQFYDT